MAAGDIAALEADGNPLPGGAALDAANYQARHRQPGAFSQGKHRNLLIFGVLNIITLTHAFESTCLCVTLPIIAADINASVADSLSLSSIFLLGMTIAQPFSSELSWMFGRRPMLVFAIFLFMAGTVICGCAHAPWLLLIGRCVQGTGAGATEPVKALILFDLYDLRERSKWMAYLNVSWALGTIAGPLLGGTLSQSPSASWRWVFWINLPLLGLSLTGTTFLLGYDKRTRPTTKAVWKNLDWNGLFLFAVSGILVLLALTWAGSRHPWKSVAVITTLLSGVCGMVLLGVYEARVARRPVFKPAIFRNLSASVLLLSVLLHGLLMWMTLYYMALYYAGIRGSSPIQTGLWALPATLTVAPMAMLVGFVVSRTGHYRSFLYGGWALTAGTFIGLHFLKADMPVAGLIGISLSGGLGFGALIPGMSVGIQATVDRNLSGDAICLTLLARPAGQALGIALGLTIFSTRLQKKLAARGFAAGTAQGLMKTITHVPPSSTVSDGDVVTQLREIIEPAVMSSLRVIWSVGVGITAFVVVLTLLIKLPRLQKDRNNNGDENDNEAIEMSPQ